jgi:hypothetical protein
VARNACPALPADDGRASLAARLAASRTQATALSFERCRLWSRRRTEGHERQERFDEAVHEPLSPIRQALSIPEGDMSSPLLGYTPWFELSDATSRHLHRQQENAGPDSPDFHLKAVSSA